MAQVSYDSQLDPMSSMSLYPSYDDLEAVRLTFVFSDPVQCPAFSRDFKRAFQHLSTLRASFQMTGINMKSENCPLLSEDFKNRKCLELDRPFFIAKVRLYIKLNGKMLNRLKRHQDINVCATVVMELGPFQPISTHFTRFGNAIEDRH